MGLSSESACASLNSVHSVSLLRLSERSLHEISAENLEDSTENQRMSTKELLKQCLAQVVQQISLFNETLKQTKKNGNVPTQITPTSNSLGKPIKRRGRPPGSKNKAALSIPSFHDLHNAPELHLKAHSAVFNDTDSVDADGTHTDASGPVGEDGERLHGSPNGDASSDASDESDDGQAVHVSYDDRMKALSNKYETAQEPGKPIVFLVYKILEMLGKGPVAEKVLRSGVVDACKDAGIKTAGKTASAAVAGFDFNLTISVMKGVQLVCEKEDNLAVEQASASASQRPSQAERPSTLVKAVRERWPAVIDAFALALTTKRAELAAQAAATAAAATMATGTSVSATAAAKDTASTSTTEAKVPQPPAAFTSPLGLPLTPVDWQLSLLDPQTLSQMMQWVQQMSRQADQFLAPRSADNRIPPGLDALLGVKDASLHTDMVVEELLRQMTLPLSLPTAAFDPAVLASVAEAHATVNRRNQAAVSSSGADAKCSTGATCSSETSANDSGTTSAIANHETKLSPKHDVAGQQLLSSNSASDAAAPRKRPLRSFELSAPVEQILQNAGALLEEWGQVSYDEARLLEQEENLLRRLAKRCGLNLPNLQTQSQSLRLGSKYLNSENPAQARPLLWDGVPLTASLLWERARKAKRQRVHSYGGTPTYTRSDDAVSLIPAHSGALASFAPPFLSRKRSGTPSTTDYPAHHVPPMRLHPSVPFTKEIPRDHTRPVELPDLTIHTCMVPWSDIAREFQTLRAPIDGTPIARDDADTFTFVDARSEDGSRSEDTNDAATVAPGLKRQKSEVLAPTFRVVAESSATQVQEETAPSADVAQSTSSSRHIAGGYRIAVQNSDAAGSGSDSDSDSEEDISDETVAARHEVVLQRMRDRFKKLQEMKNKQQEQLSITAPQGTMPSSTVTSPKKGRKGKSKSHRSHGRSHSKMAASSPRGAAPPAPGPGAFSMPFASATSSSTASVKCEELASAAPTTTISTLSEPSPPSTAHTPRAR